MGINDPTIYGKCPRCGGLTESDGVDVGIGYVYPPLHCVCGWSELCGLKNSDTCLKCDQYEYCKQQLETEVDYLSDENDYEF